MIQFLFQPSGSHRGSKTNLTSELEHDDEHKSLESDGKMKVRKNVLKFNGKFNCLR